MNHLEITSLLVSNNQDINKQIKTIVGVIHMHRCLSLGIK